jgi:hypothetical protein
MIGSQHMLLNWLTSGKGLLLIIGLAMLEMFSVPVGIYLAYKTDSLFHGLASFFVPLYGIVYAVAHYLF